MYDLHRFLAESQTTSEPYWFLSIVVLLLILLFFNFRRPSTSLFERIHSGS